MGLGEASSAVRLELQGSDNESTHTAGLNCRLYNLLEDRDPPALPFRPFIRPRHLLFNIVTPQYRVFIS